MPTFNPTILRKPEQLLRRIADLRELHPEYADIADVACMALDSSASNDYLEKLGAESIGATHLTEKLGPDGMLDGKGIEVKPCKKSPAVASIGVINDDSPSKLLKTHTEYSWIVFLNSEKGSARVNWALAFPYKYYEPSRYTEIVKRLKLLQDPSWTWGGTLPAEGPERTRCLEALVGKTKPYEYVRASPLNLSVLADIPANEVTCWKHPDVDTKKIHPILRPFADGAATSIKIEAAQPTLEVHYQES